MIKWFIDNLKPPYYEKMISAQVTHFTSLIPIWECIDEGIRRKKIVNLEALSSMIEQQVKKVNDHKGRTLTSTRLTKRLKGSKVSPLLIQPRPLDLIRDRFSQPKHFLEHLTKREGWNNPAILEENLRNSLCY